MERGEVIKTNQMFARFTGHIYNPHGHEREYLISRYGTASYPLCKLKYHCSLNWMFIVIDKIEKDGKWNVTISSDVISLSKYNGVLCSQCRISSINDRNGARLETRQEFIYRALTHFLTAIIDK